MIIPFKEYLPDQADFMGGADVSNAAPAAEGYRSFPSLSAYSTALDARCQGAVSVQDDDGNVHTFAGDAAKLYKLEATTPTDYSISGGYTTGADESWAFAKYGEKLIATNWNNYPQTITLNGTQFSNLTTDFRARTVAQVLEFVFFGNIWDLTNGSRPNVVKWSAQGDSTDYTPAVSTQSGEQELPDAGWVQHITGGEYATIFCENEIWRGTPVGGQLKYSFRRLEKRGTPAPNSFAEVGGVTFYLGQDGFYAFNGEYSEPIGAEKVDKTFFAEIDKSYWPRVTAAVDPGNRLIIWSYPTTTASGVPDKCLAYHWPSGKWAPLIFNHEILINYLTPGYTLEGLDAVSADLDALTPTLDSKTWMGGNRSIAALDTSHRVATFTGTALAATFTTEERQLTPGRKTTLREIRPLIDGGTVTVTVITRDDQSDATAESSAITAAPSGRYATRSTARYHRVKTVTSGAFTHAIGVDVQGIPRGSR